MARDDEYFVEWSNAQSGGKDSDDAVSLDSASDVESLRSDESESVGEEKVDEEEEEEEVVCAQSSEQRDVGDNDNSGKDASENRLNTVCASGDMPTSCGDMKGTGVGGDHQ